MPARESWSIEDRMIRHRKLVQREHPEYRGQGRAENRALEGNRNKCRQLWERASGNIDRIFNRRGPVEQKVACQATDNASNQDDQRQ